MIDTHTHSTFSFDGKSTAREMALRGQELGLTYMCTTDHCDFDYLFMPKYKDVPQIQLDKYVPYMEELKKEFPFLHLGIEIGFSKKAQPMVLEKVPFEKFDYILNSCHTVGEYDAYNKEFFVGKDKHTAYKMYLDNIRESLEVKYPYNTVSHIGYVRKNAPYEDTELRYEEFEEELDGILKRIIELGKALEINGKLSGDRFMPERDILQKYYQFGGRKITFGSDAHSTDVLTNKFAQAQEMAKSVGFDHWTAFEKQQPIEIPF